jgi:hypothetical protein
MKKIYDVETIYKNQVHREAVHAESAEEAFNIISKKYDKERITRVTERKNS